MDQRTDDIRQNIEETRSSLDSKLNQLEAKANDATDTVREASQKVRETFDIRGQVEERPWTALGIAVAAGYVLGSMGGSNEPDYYRYNQRSGSQSNPTGVGYSQPSTTGVGYSQQSTGPSTTDKIKEKGSDFLSQFDDEIDMLKGAAVAALTTFIRDSVREYAPSMSRHIDDALRQRGLPVNNSTLSSGSSSGTNYTGSSSAATYPSSGTTSPTGSPAGSRQVSSASSESFDAMSQMPNADYDNIGQMNRVGMPPANNPSDSEYYETYTPSTESNTAEPPAVQPRATDEYARDNATNYTQ